MGILKSFEFNKVNKGVEEEIKYLQIPNKIKYFTFWGSIIVATALSYTYVTSSLTSVSNKASLLKGDAPIVAFFETNWENKVLEIKKDFEDNQKVLNEKNQFLKQISGEATSTITIANFIQTLNDEDILNQIKKSEDFKKMVSFENKFKLLSSNETIILNENTYKIVDILNKLATLEDAVRFEAIEEPLNKIVDLKIVDLEKGDLKNLIFEIINDKDSKNFTNALGKYKTAEDMLKASLNQIKRGIFELNFGMYIGSMGLKIPLENTRLALETMLKNKNDAEAKKIEDSKNKIDSVKKEIEDLKNIQLKRSAFLVLFNSVNTENYFEKKEQLKISFSEIK